MKDLKGFISHLKAQVTQNQHSIDAYTVVAKDFIEFMGGRQEITQDIINEFLTLQSHVYKNNSMISRSGGLRHFLRYNGYDIRRKNENESRGFLVKIPKARYTRTTKEWFLTEDEIQRIFISAKKNPYEYALVRIFYYTTQRISSILALNIPDIDFEKKTITFLKMKKGDTRPTPHTVTIDDETVEAIKMYLNGRTEGAVFLNKTLPTRLNDDQCRRHLKELSIDANLPREKKLIPHNFRRCSLTHKKQRGMQDSDIMKISGHIDPQSLKAYDCTDIEDVRAVNEMYTPKFDMTAKPKLTELEEKDQRIKQLEERLQRLEKSNMPKEVYSK